MTNAAFTELIQLHERQWGMEQYPGRPSLADLLTCPIVAMWVSNTRPSTEVKRTQAGSSQPAERFVLTAHRDYDELDALVTSAVVIGHPSFASNWKLSRLFVNQQAVKAFVRVQIIDE
jgi:hypothetical protein